jgi:two-component system, NarL family, invasion response regulator UvrY
MRIYIVDRQPVFREGLKRILNKSGEWEVVGEADTCGEIYEKIVVRNGKSGAGCDVITLDGEFESLRVLERLAEARPQGWPPSTLIISAHSETLRAIQMLRLGANGYIHKSSPPDLIIDAIRKVSRGRNYVTSEAAENLISNWASGSRLPSMSKREYQVLYLFASGLTIAAIAQQLELSAKTVSTYRGRLVKKFGLKNSGQLIKYALELGLAGE